MRVSIGLGAMVLAVGCVSTGENRPPGADTLGDSSTGSDSLTLGSLVTGLGDSSGTGGDDGSTSADTGTSGDGTSTSSGSEDSGSEGSTTGGTDDLPEYCGREVPMAGDDPLIDDLELETGQMLPDDQIPEIDGRVGFWFTYNDGSAMGTQAPEPGSFQPTAGGAAGSSYAAGTLGSGFSTWGAGMGVKLNNDFSGDCPYDASSYDGITFEARGNVTARLSVTTRATHPIESGGTCDPDAGQCSDHFGVIMVLQPDWQLYTITWDQLDQQGWGIPAEFDPSQIIEIQWQAPVTVPFEVYVDELSFATQ